MPAASFSSPAFTRLAEVMWFRVSFEPVSSSTRAISSFCESSNDAVVRYLLAVASGWRRMPTTDLPICASVLAYHFSLPESMTVADLSCRWMVPRPVRSRPCKQVR